MKKIIFITSFFLLTACHYPLKYQDAGNDNAELGMIYLNQGDVQAAKAKLLLAVEQSPDDPAVNDAMGYFLERTGEIQSARVYYQHALTLAPNRGDVNNNYGGFLCRHGQYQEAITHFLKAAHDPEYLQVAQAYENAGVCALKIHDTKQAKDYFSKAADHNPVNVTLGDR